MPEQVDEILRRLKALEESRRNWDANWQEVSELVMPRRSDFISIRPKGDKRGMNAVDSTAIIANELLGAGLHGMLTNPASKWFTLRITDANLMHVPQVLQWLDEVENRIFAQLNSSSTSFSSHMHELYMDITAFGTAVMFIGEDDEKGEVTFSTRHLKECYLAENQHGIIDTVYRKFEFTVRQIVQKWGMQKAGDEVKKLWDKEKFDVPLDILHACYPRKDKFREPGKKTPEAMPWASTYVLCKHKHIIDEGGFEEMPYVAPRWVKAAGEIYGRGPGINNLPDIKMLQEMSKTIIKAAQKVVDPPLQLEDDSVLSPVRTVPGGLNFRRPGSERIEPLITGADLPVGFEMLRDLRERIRSGFYIDQLQLNTGPQMTATEVLQRTEEKLRLLGPVLGRLQSELLSPLVNRVFGLSMRRGKFPPPPEVLAEAEYNVEYVSPLARAQKQVEANGLLRMFEIGTPLLQIAPQAGEVMKAEDSLRWLGGLFGVPNSLFKTPEELAKIREAQAQAQAQAQMAEEVVQGADVVQKLAAAAPSDEFQAG